MKNVLFMLVAAVAVFAQTPNYRPHPTNAMLFWEDSARVDGTDAVTFKAVWQDEIANKVLLVECRDDSSSGFASDSACVRVTAYQVFPMAGAQNSDLFVMLNSRANPDSTTKYGSSVFNLFDSLNIKSMDTACVWKRNYVLSSNTWGSKGPYPGDSLKTLQTSGYGAFAYTALPVDFSPAYTIKLTGLAPNAKRGAGSMWKLRIYGLRGVMTKAGN